MKEADRVIEVVAAQRETRVCDRSPFLHCFEIILHIQVTIRTRGVMIRDTSGPEIRTLEYKSRRECYSADCFAFAYMKAAVLLRVVHSLRQLVRRENRRSTQCSRV